jgi:hypothetical protein
MAKPSYSDLVDWYLARLRSMASRQAGAKLTPRALVRSDADLIKDMVTRSGITRDSRTAKILAEIRRNDRTVRFFQNAISWSGALGALVFLVLMLR